MTTSGVQALFVALVGFLLLGVVYASTLISERQDALSRISHYNLAWTAGQTQNEVARAQAAIGAQALSTSAAGREAIETWLELVQNRIRILGEGEVGRFVSSHGELARIVQQLSTTVESALSMGNALETPAGLGQLMRDLQRLNGPLARLASVAHSHGADLSERDTQEIRRLHWRFSALLVGLIVCSLAIALIASWRNRLLLRSNAEINSLVVDLRQAGDRLSAANVEVNEAYSALASQNAALEERDAELMRQNELFDAALNNMSQALGMFDSEDRLIVCNRRFGLLLGIEPDLLLPGTYAAVVFNAASEGGTFGSDAMNKTWATHLALSADNKPGAFAEADGAGRCLAVSQQPLADGGWVATYEDVTESRRIEAQVRHLADHDALTGLPNRRRLNDELSGALDGGLDVALLFLDLDRFKNVNDTLGHAVGDELLRAATARVAACVRRGDIVARLGGDEFAILLRGRGANRRSAEHLAGRIVRTLSEPFDLGRYQASVGASVGIALSTGRGTSADALAKHADVALYRAKSAGRGRFCTFEDEMAAELQARRDLEADLRLALDHGELEVHYQPVFDLRRGRVSGFEALLRWQHPLRGMVSPAEFIPLAEETGLILPIGEWVMRRACLDAAGLPDDVKVAVNISPVQFAGDDLYQVVLESLAASGMDPSRLEVEITETALLQDSESVITALQKMREIGICVSLDDFGTKYSSLSYLRRFPFDKIKIDQSFVRDMGTRSDCLAIVRSVARLADQLGMTATAEGIETSAQLEQVREAGCAQGQGYFFGAAVPAEELGRWLEPQLPSLVIAA